MTNAKSLRMTSASLPLLLTLSSFLVQGVHANCFIDQFGVRRCDRFSRAARIGIGIAVSIGFLVLFCLLMLFQRRRTQRRNLAFVSTSQSTTAPPAAQVGSGTTFQGSAFNSVPFSAGRQQQQPQYPAPTFNGASQGNFAPPPGPPPPPENTNFAPPSFAPPGYSVQNKPTLTV